MLTLHIKVELIASALESHFASMQPMDPAAQGVRVCVNIEYGSTYVGAERSSAGDAIVKRIGDKLAGFDFGASGTPLSVEEQVARAINAATSEENLALMWEGWLPHV
jgi:hypothetical protein